ncbi:hypothetical protein CRX42_24440 [Pseudomonas jessenii]|uniref:Uncharacterized protein n=1 Tax=Pseudomonas jessenii TaxID=77298 RepID=A0A2W0EJ10_PSEJE|nr:hypothetical protein CRX42_24440 [Pseudomonas jessenii]
MTTFASRLAPTGDHRQTQIPKTPNNLVGAGLPAMRPAHPASISPDSPPSLASQLLQGVVEYPIHHLVHSDEATR